MDGQPDGFGGSFDDSFFASRGQVPKFGTSLRAATAGSGAGAGSLPGGCFGLGGGGGLPTSSSAMPMGLKRPAGDFLTGADWDEGGASGNGMPFGGVAGAASLVGSNSMVGMLGASGGASGMEVLMAVLQMVPANVAGDARGFSMRCAVPDSLVARLLGADDRGTKEIEDCTGARIQISKQVSDSEHRAVSITGPIFSTVAAYIRLMKRYMEVEAAAIDQGTHQGLGHSGMPFMETHQPRLDNNLFRLPPPANGPPPQVVAQLEQQLQQGLQQLQALHRQPAGGGLGK